MSTVCCVKSGTDARDCSDLWASAHLAAIAVSAMAAAGVSAAAAAAILPRAKENQSREMTRKHE